MSTQIHPTAIVHPNAVLATGVEIGPFCLVGENVTINRNTKLLAHCVVNGRTTIGEDCIVHPFAAIGGPSQDKKATAGEMSYVKIGDRCVIREYVTVNRATGDGESTAVGDDCWLLAYTHVSHNSRIGNGVVMSNLAQLAGHCTVQDNVTIGGQAGVHQFVRIGRLAMVGGATKLARDVPPFFLCDGSPAGIYGLNKIGLQRAGVSLEAQAELKEAYKILYRSNRNLSQALAVLVDKVETPEGHELVEFLTSESKRGILK
ncbi:MAG TPA: acyl-ACP--UDP-N-acetylglucosamine O-acyltransferase [Candidatus Dormibacteraeota bacterium]|nr:acyl-ACP--UDP-N-acetylglucosamine O-acyltransferase [Candidatus Dormibacteraeota bacterium]